MTAEVYKARDGWRWRIQAANGRIIAESGEAYTRRASAVRAFDTLFSIDSISAEIEWWVGFPT